MAEERISKQRAMAATRCAGAAMPSVIVTVMMMMMAAAGVQSSDPEVTKDFAVPPGVNASTVDGSYFTFTGLRDFAAPAGAFGSKKVTLVEFPALEGLGVGVTLLEYSPGTVNPPHTHPRGTELLYVLNGALHVGLVDTAGKLFTQTLRKGDLFVFPKGLVHFQMNMSSKTTARALASFSSSNAGTNSLPAILFGSGISDAVLTKAFKVSGDTIDLMEAPFQPAA